MERAKEICPTTSMGKLKEGAILVDIRELKEINEVAFGVVNQLIIPLSEFEERYQEIPKDKEVIIACLGGSRSLKAVYYLMNHGYKTVYNMREGMEKWARKGFPIQGDASHIIETSSCCSNDGCC